MQPALQFAPITNVDVSSGLVFYPNFKWPQPAVPGGRSFNAVHMSVIPKGAYRGHVLVWNELAVVGAVNPPGVPALSSPGPNQIVTQSYQAYAIIDPAEVPLGDIRYRNFLVPIGAEILQPDSLPLVAKSMFCAGHAWSQFGDLIVSGATEFVLVFPEPPAEPYIDYSGGMLTYVFNPRQTCIWPNTQIEYYPSPASSVPTPSPNDYYGMWVQAPDLALRRWYPTVTLTHRIARGSPTTANRERALVSGGVEEVSPTHPNDRARVTYEAYAILAEAVPLASNLEPDVAVGFPSHLPSPVPAPYPPVPANRVFDGPGFDMQLQAFVQALGEYPRTFMVSTGKAFVCGYEPRSAWLDHESPGTWPLTVDQPGAPGVYSSNWPSDRHDGSAVLFPNFGLNNDVVLRLGGAPGFTGPTTDTMESIAAGNPASTWTSAPSIPEEGTTPDGGRLFCNTVILPTGGLLIVGGQWQDGNGAKQPFYAPMLFEGGQWEKMPPNPIASRRNYHSTAVLLPDGRVFLGGGDDRDWDYEIFSPPYLNDPVVRPTNPDWQAPVPFVDAAMGAPVLGYGQRYEVLCDPLPLGHAITKAVLTAPCSVTHHSDMHQRYVEMDTVVQNGNRVWFYLPNDERQAPRGIYMLWLVTNTGTPSVAEWVVLR